MIKGAWNYAVWKAFNHELYSEALTKENILGNGVEEFYEYVCRIDNGTAQEYVIEPEAYRNCIRLDKGDKKYILPAKFQDDLPIKPGDTFPCQIKRSDKRIWNFVTEPVVMSIGGVKQRELKQFIDEWNPLEHSNPETATLLKMIMVASLYKGLKMCICSEPRAGKNSSFTLANTILNNVWRGSQPTLAKFETVLYYYDIILPDEITSMSPTEIKKIEPTILIIADESPEFNKHSMASNKNLNNIDILEKSILFFYNRPEDMDDPTNFFEKKWTNIGALRDRYPMILVKGKYIETMPKLNRKQGKEIMKTNFPEMRTIAKELVYWKENLHKHLHHWNRSKIDLSSRHMPNMEGLFDVIDVYSESQTVFDTWVKFLLTCKQDYHEMIYGKPFDNGKLIVEEEFVK